MAVDPRKRQKKLERKAAKRKKQQHQLAREKSAGLPERIASASRYPVLHCWVSDDLWDKGLGWVCLSRELPNGFVAFAVFLMDRYCLGVKDAMADVNGRFTYDKRVTREWRGRFTTKDMDPASARKLVEGAVDYAASLGFHPHPDYHKAKLIFGDLDPSASTETFEYGKDGKPLFVAGPYDTPERCRQILRTLTDKVGPDGFHFMMPLFEDEDVLPEALQERANLMDLREQGEGGDEEADHPEGEGR
jgi:hypothetical protein